MKIDSNLTFEESVKNTQAPKKIADELSIIDVYYIGFDDHEHKGQLVIHNDLVEDVQKIFEELKEIKFPIEKVIPIIKYNWNDTKSMLDNNSSAFNYRHVHNKNELSNHSFGRAIDINPIQNPYIDKNGESIPAGCFYNPETKGTIVSNSAVVKIFDKYGWEWGGNWGETRGYFDFQHFQKI